MTRLLPALLAAAAVALASCGEDDEPAPPTTAPSAQETATAEREAPTATARKDATIVVRESEFGPMLFDSRRQAIYIFENDAEDETVCYDECAEAWPPVLTEGEPVAGRGTNASLFGTIERRDGTRQVTYAGQPLYFYAHEDPGQVRCHNVNLNGGLWWVVGADGKRRP